MLTTTTVVLRIYKDGRVKYTTLLNYDVNCPMNFVFYPFDKQASSSSCDGKQQILVLRNDQNQWLLKVCTVGFESFDFTSEELWISWMPEVSSS